MLQGQTYVFIKYIDETIKQYKVYALDLQTTVRFSVVNFKEETKGGTIDLNLLGENLQGMQNVLPTCKLVRRLKELLLPVVKLLP